MRMRGKEFYAEMKRKKHKNSVVEELNYNVTWKNDKIFKCLPLKKKKKEKKVTTKICQNIATRRKAWWNETLRKVLLSCFSSLLFQNTLKTSKRKQEQAPPTGLDDSFLFNII